MANFNPLILDGSVPKSKRSLIIDEYQAHNLNKRLIICNLAVGALGIDLDDTTPNGIIPRYAFVSPSYYAMLLHQVTRRFYRANTTSQPHIRFVYGKCGIEETSILNSLSKKKDVMKQTLINQVNAGIKFPGEYTKEIQGDDIPLMDIPYNDINSDNLSDQEDEVPSQNNNNEDNEDDDNEILEDIPPFTHPSSSHVYDIKQTTKGSPKENIGNLIVRSTIMSGLPHQQSISMPKNIPSGVLPQNLPKPK